MKKLIILMLILLFSSVVYAQTRSLEIVKYDGNILAERGWVKYIDVDVKNNGDVTLDNVDVSVEGVMSSWFDAQTENVSISPNDTATFILKLFIPTEQEKGKYDFFIVASSGETETREAFAIELFSSQSELLLDQIQEFRERVDDLKTRAKDSEIRGKNVDSVNEFLAEASPILEAASNDVLNERYEDATEKIRNVEVLLTKAEYDLSVATSVENTSQAVTFSFSLEWILILALSIIIILLLLWFFVFKKHKINKKIPGSIPGLKIKRFVLKKKDKKRSKNQIEDMEEAASLLEEEYREGLISKKSYEEMKTKYEEKILELKTKG